MLAKKLQMKPLGQLKLAETRKKSLRMSNKNQFLRNQLFQFLPSQKSKDKEQLQILLT